MATPRTTVTAVSINSYTKPSNQDPNKIVDVFVYAIQGNQHVKEAYIQATQKQISKKTGMPVEVRYEDNDPSGRPLFFTGFYSGENITIGFKFSDGTPFVDNSRMSKMGSIVSQAERTSPLLAQAMANEAARELLGINQSNRTLAPQSTSTATAGLNRGDADNDVNNQGNPDAVQEEVQAGSADPDEM